eukprot:TRINITY_DN3925_c0_g1_i11.p2 TRINITY_DN3925_c0_g1~~TRINITY_DN3925_c0_g1_i11.p2  ORF type:complete len:160 (-),score=22.52 TRINITY_DN3925_c0_g1_i11:165-644(-)
MKTITSRSKLMKELSVAKKSTDKEVKLNIKDDSIYSWRAYILGPVDTSYQDHYFELDFRIPPDYPMSPPQVKFLTKVFHPNVHWETGEICLDILKADTWTPAWTLESVCRAIINLLSDPNADSPLNCDCGNLIRGGDMRGYKSMALMYTIEHGITSVPP